MKRPLLLVVALLVATASASELSDLIGLGQYVDVTGKPRWKVEPATKLQLESRNKVLDRIAFDMAQLDTSHYVIVSGRVVSSNTGFGVNLVPIYIGGGSHVPRLAGVTNQEGEFKFRLDVKEHTANDGIYVPPSFEGFLYLGGLPSVTRGHLDQAILKDGLSERYPIKGLMDWVARQKLKQPN